MSAEPVSATQRLRATARAALEVAWTAWAQALPPEAATEWRRGCAYVRESSINSLVASAPDVQLRNTLAHLASKRIYVLWEGVFFDNASGTDTATRVEFQRLFEQVLAGGYKTVGVFVAERMFRNLEQATKVRREFRTRGIELEYVGRFEGDSRSPASWQLEVMQDMAAEAQARQTGYYTGRHIESLTRDGKPVGPLPEAYEEAKRAEHILGKRGSVIEWRVVEPLATILQEGLRRYFAGASYSDLARWSATTELKGVTPKGRVMNHTWWRAALQNPKYAGYQKPTNYQGFRPGKVSPARERRSRDSELVPCLLPPLWTLDDYQKVLATGDTRRAAPKERLSYRAYLLGGIAVDARCGHSMGVRDKQDDGRYWLACSVLGTGGRDHPQIQADVAERELDALIGRIRLDDAVLRRQVEEEVRELARAEDEIGETFRPDPAIGALRRAIAELRSAGIEDAGLARKLQEAERADSERRETQAAPVRALRSAAAALDNWSEVWATADTRLKNELLREAGVTAVIGRDAGQETGPAHLQAVGATDSIFALALAVALGDSQRTFDGHQPYEPSDLRTIVLLDEQAGPVAERLGILTADGRGVAVARPDVEATPRRRSKHRPPPGRGGRVTAWRKRLDLPAGDPDRLNTVRQAADAACVPGWLIYRLADKGRIEVVRVGPNGGTLLIPEAELPRIKAEDEGRRRFPRRVDLRAE